MEQRGSSSVINSYIYGVYRSSSSVINSYIYGVYRSSSSVINSYIYGVYRSSFTTKLIAQAEAGMGVADWNVIALLIGLSSSLLSK